MCGGEQDVSVGLVQLGAANKIWGSSCFVLRMILFHIYVNYTYQVPLEGILTALADETVISFSALSQEVLKSNIEDYMKLLSLCFFTNLFFN